MEIRRWLLLSWGRSQEEGEEEMLQDQGLQWLKAHRSLGFVPQIKHQGEDVGADMFLYQNFWHLVGLRAVQR
jgi:hypothetical protein